MADRHYYCPPGGEWTEVAGDSIKLYLSGCTRLQKARIGVTTHGLGCEHPEARGAVSSPAGEFDEAVRVINREFDAARGRTSALEEKTAQLYKRNHALRDALRDLLDRPAVSSLLDPDTYAARRALADTDDG